MNTFNQISQSATYKEDEIAVCLSVCGGSYGGGSEVLVVYGRFESEESIVMVENDIPEDNGAVNGKWIQQERNARSGKRDVCR